MVVVRSRPLRVAVLFLQVQRLNTNTSFLQPIHLFRFLRYAAAACTAPLVHIAPLPCTTLGSSTAAYKGDQSPSYTCVMCSASSLHTFLFYTARCSPAGLYLHLARTVLDVADRANFAAGRPEPEEGGAGWLSRRCTRYGQRRPSVGLITRSSRSRRRRAL